MLEHDLLAHPPPLTRFGWVDNAGLSRAKAVTPRSLPGALRYGFGMTVGQQALPMMVDAVIPETGLGAVGEVRLKPDLAAAAVLPFTNGQVLLPCDMQTLTGEVWSHCPRSFLKRQLDALAALGYTLRASFENEFYLFRPDGTGGWQPLDETVYATLDAYDTTGPFLDEALSALTATGLEPESYYPESGPGQQEIAIAPALGVGAADRQVLFKTVIRSVARRQGLRASFCAKPVETGAGSGCHLHLSLVRNGENAFYDGADSLGLSPLAYHAIGGLLGHAAGLCALTVPSVNSYRRLQPGWWAGAYACYGLDHREASIRVLSGHLMPGAGGASAHFELKSVDGSCNPYLALGGAVAAMLDGIGRQVSPGPALTGAPGEVIQLPDHAERITPLPTSLTQAADALEADAVLGAALGDDLRRSFLAVRRFEAAYFAEHPELELAAHRFVY
jgi:glutamine synthetase